MDTAMRDMLWVLTQVSTLTFVIHLWYIMKAFIRVATVLELPKFKQKKLLISPYALAFIPVAELFYPPGIIFGLRVEVSIKPCFFVLTIITVLFDADLLALCCRYRVTLQRQAELTEAIPPRSMQVKFLVFCIIRVVLSAFCIYDLIQPQQSDILETDLIMLAEGIYPLLVSVVIGTKMLPVAKFGRWLASPRLGCVGGQILARFNSEAPRGASELQSASLAAQGSLNERYSVLWIRPRDDSPTPSIA
ncbi:hypothetical protein BU17DRAFT_100542 [Hysterangium stoloniferum]|nr:hypothetical protein BU17DRAFT_100542 [Hysterangium stoloniferum]